jgi:hypothetical protein
MVRPLQAADAAHEQEESRADGGSSTGG